LRYVFAQQHTRPSSKHALFDHDRHWRSIIIHNFAPTSQKVLFEMTDIILTGMPCLSIIFDSLFNFVFIYHAIQKIFGMTCTPLSPLNTSRDECTTISHFIQSQEENIFYFLTIRYLCKEFKSKRQQ